MLDAEKFESTVPPGAEKYLESVPYDVARRELYTARELFAGFDPQVPSTWSESLDARVSRHLDATGRIDCRKLEDWARSMHDYHIRRAMYRFLEWFEPRQVVGIMGGHGLRRDDPAFRQVVDAAKLMTERNALMVSGGGPGAMEATHVGAWLAGRTKTEVDAAMAMLAAAPCVDDERWLASAFEVMERFPQEQGHQSLGIPTWHYQGEPPTPFATVIAKMFNNAIREDVLLTETYGGLVVMPGGPGTLQEVFQEAVQEHYGEPEQRSPMVFVGRDFWTREVPVYSLVTKLQRDGFYRNLDIYLADTTEEIVAALERFQRLER